MTSTNLTRDEARRRSELISNVHYTVELDFSAAADLNRATFPTRTLVRFTSGAGDTFLDLRAPHVHRVVLDGVDVTGDGVGKKEDASDRINYDATRGIQLRNLTAGEHEVLVEAEGAYSTTGEGLHRFRDPADGEVYMYTQFETADAKRVFACFDQPDIKATYDLFFATPPSWRVITNNEVTPVAASGLPQGAVADDARATAAGHPAEGAQWCHSRVDYLLSTYLIALCVGPWHEVRDTWIGRITPHPETNDAATANARQRGELITSGDQSVPLGLYCRQSLASHLDAEEIFTITKQGFDYYAAHFGIGYPFYKYDQVFCPEYNMGAMENAGAVTIRDEYVFRSAASHYEYERRADTILHELAHMWFGDLVTMRWWDDLWLNESFATWSAAMSQANATKFTTAWVTFANKEKAWAYAQDQLSTTHPVFSDASDIVTVDANFDGITYAKGASVLKQLAAYVGLEAFFAGIRAHFAAHAWSNATFDDLLGALERASGRDLSSWADQWLKTTGINTLRADFDIAEDGSYSRFRVRQSGAQPGAGETRTHRVAIGVYRINSAADGVVERCSQVEADISGEETTIPALEGLPAGDLVLVNDDDLTYACMELDPQSMRCAIQHIARIADPMARSLIWATAWQMTRDSKLLGREFLELVARGSHTETELAVLEQILAQARQVAQHYVPVSRQDAAWEILHEAFLRGARECKGQAQLAFVRALAGCVHSARSAQALAALLGEQQDADAADIAPGLDIDQDLRWQLIIGLTGAARATGEDEATLRRRIDAEQERDGSSSGAMLAVQATAAIPSPTEKQRVWEEIVANGPRLSNLWLRHAIAGLTHFGHGDLLEPMAKSYPRVASRLWSELSPEMALRTLEGLYPLWDQSEETEQQITALLEAPDTPVGLRRTLKEGRDRVARFRAARRCETRTFDAEIG